MSEFKKELKRRRRERALFVGGDVDEALNEYFDGFRLLEDAYQLMCERKEARKEARKAAKKAVRSDGTRPAFLEHMRAVRLSDVLLPAAGFCLLFGAGALLVSLISKSE